MSVLIDSIIKQCASHTKAISIGDLKVEYFIAKPWYSNSLKYKLIDCYRILTNKSRAYHFKEDV